MSLTKDFEKDLHEAMRAKDETARNTLRLIITSIKNAEIEKSAALDDSAILSILQKEIKMRRESILEFQKGNRADLIQLSERELKILEKYLPAQLSDHEIEKIVKDVIMEISATSPADIGKVMKIVIPKLAGKAASDKVSSIVRSQLS
jgi:uncharacterized protein YqeY